jgi:adenylate kinase
MKMVLLGAPGSGKGTQGAHLAERCGAAQFAVMERLRREMRNHTPFGLRAQAAADTDQPIPDAILMEYVEELLTSGEAGHGFILDGFPRNLQQAIALDQLLQSLERPLQLVIWIDCDEEILMQRLTGRRTCRDCHQIYNIYTNPPRLEDECDQCGGPLKHRAEDNEETIAHRIKTYLSAISPILEHYREQGLLHRIDGQGEVDEINAAIANACQQFSNPLNRE